MDIAENVEVQNNGRVYHIGKVTGTGKLGGSCTFSNGGSVGANTWQVGNDDNWTTSVIVSSNANFNKVGRGSITWNGQNTTPGTTTVSEGELMIGSKGGSLGTGRLNVNEGAVLSGDNTGSAGKPLSNSTTVINGTLRPGTFEGATTGALDFGNKPLTINETGVLSIYARRCASARVNGCSALRDISTLTINGTIRVDVTSSTHSLAVGDSIRIFNATTVVGPPKVEFVGNVLWDTSRLSEGLLFVKAIGVEGINGVLSEDRPTDIYDLRGRLVRRAATSIEGLAHGVYVSEGRKFVIKK